MKKIIIATATTAIATATVATFAVVSARKKIRMENLKTCIHGTADSCKVNARYAKFNIDSKWLSIDERDKFNDTLKNLIGKVDPLVVKATESSDESELNQILLELENILQDILKLKDEAFDLVLNHQRKGYDDFLQSLNKTVL